VVLPARQHAREPQICGPRRRGETTTACRRL